MKLIIISFLLLIATVIGITAYALIVPQSPQQQYALFMLVVKLELAAMLSAVITGIVLTILDK